MVGHDKSSQESYILNLDNGFMAFDIVVLIPIPNQNLCFVNVFLKSTNLEQLGNILGILLIDSQPIPSWLSFRFQIKISVLEMFLLSPPS